MVGVGGGVVNFWVATAMEKVSHVEPATWRKFSGLPYPFPPATVKNATFEISPPKSKPQLHGMKTWENGRFLQFRVWVAWVLDDPTQVAVDTLKVLVGNFPHPKITVVFPLPGIAAAGRLHAEHLIAYPFPAWQNGVVKFSSHTGHPLFTG